MSRTQFWGLFAVAGLLLAPQLVFGADVIPVSPAARAALGIEVVAAEERSRFAAVETSAMVIAPPGRLRPIVSPFEGAMVEPYALPGVAVEAGQPLALAYSPDFITGLAELKTAQRTADHREQIAARKKQMLSRGLSSTEEVDEAKHDAETARLTANALAERMAAFAPVDGQPGHFQILTPANGVVVHVHVATGVSIRAGAPVVSVFTGEEYWARAMAPERLADVLTLGASVTIHGMDVPGKILSVDPEVDPQSRSIEVLIRLPTSPSWKLGRILDVGIMADAPPNAVSVPSRALLRLGGEDVVFVERREGFEPLAVSVVGRSRQRVLIRGPIATGERVVVSGLAALKNMAGGA